MGQLTAMLYMAGGTGVCKGARKSSTASFTDWISGEHREWMQLPGPPPFPPFHGALQLTEAKCEIHDEHQQHLFSDLEGEILPGWRR